MKLPKKIPQLSVRVYPGENANEFKMVALEPKELSVFKLEGTKWVTEDGVKHKTHRHAMRHIARKLADKAILKALPSPVASPKPITKEELRFQSREDAIQFLFQDSAIVKALIKELDRVTMPVEGAVK